MKRFIMFLLTLVIVVSSSAQITISADEFNALPDSVKVELQKSNLEKKTEETLKKGSTYANLGKEIGIGIAVNETLKAVESSAIRISKTELGQTAIFILKWKLLYKDILGVLVGGIFLIVGIGTLISTLVFCSKNDLRDEGAQSRVIIGGIAVVFSVIISLCCIF